MTPILKSRLPIYNAAWLATAIVTFCLGRMTSGTLRETVFGGAKSEGRGAALETGTLGNSNTGSKGAVSEDVLGRVFGGHATTLAQVLGGKTLEEHLKTLLKLDDEAVRMLGFLRLLEALNNPDDIKTALELIAKEGNGRFRVTEQSMLLQKWAQIDPKAAAAYASSQRDFSRFTGMSAVLRTWLKASPDEAIAWAEQNGVQNQNDQQNDRGPGRGGPEDGNWAIATLMGPLAQQNLDRAMELAKNQTVSRARGRMIDTLVDEMLAQRGMDAARNALTDLPDDAFRAGMAGRLVEKMMADSDPKDVATLAWNFPSGETRERAMAEAVGRVARNDLVAAGKLLQQFGNSPDLDSAKADYAQTLLRGQSQQAEPAIDWAKSIVDDKQRTETLQSLVRGIARQNPTLAQDYATQLGISLQQQRQGGGGGGVSGGGTGAGGFGGGGRFRGGGGGGGGR